MKRVLAFILVAAIGSSAAEGADFVRIKASSARLRVSASTKSAVVATVKQGDVFEVGERTSSWIGVVTPSTEYRYVTTSIVEEVAAPPAFPTATNRLRNACHEVVAAQDRADREAQQRYPDPDFQRQITFQRVLYDKYELPIFEQYDIAPAHYAHLHGTCAKNRWF